VKHFYIFLPSRSARSYCVCPFPPTSAFYDSFSYHRFFTNHLAFAPASETSWGESPRLGTARFISCTFPPYWSWTRLKFTFFPNPGSVSFSLRFPFGPAPPRPVLLEERWFFDETGSFFPPSPLDVFDFPPYRLFVELSLSYCLVGLFLANHPFPRRSNC